MQTIRDDAQHRATKLAGLTLVLGMVIVVFGNFYVGGGLLVPDNAIDTARNILAHETRFRLFVVCDLIYLLNLLVLLSALYAILRPVDRVLALTAAVCRMVYALFWAATTLAMMGGLRFLGGAPYLRSFDPSQVQALSRMLLRAGYDAYYLGLPFFALASTLCSWLWLRSRLIPRTLAIFGLLASGWGVICAFAFLIDPGFNRVVNDWLFDVPLGIFEMSLGLWIVFRGVRTTDTR